MSVLSLPEAVDPVFFDVKFRKEASKSLSKVFQDSRGATFETTITYESKTFEISIGAIILYNGDQSATYSMWNFSKSAQTYFITNNVPITEIKILSILCNDVYIKTTKFDPFKGYSKPGHYEI